MQFSALIARLPRIHSELGRVTPHHSETALSNAWMARLAHQNLLADLDVAALAAAHEAPRIVAPREVIASEGDAADTMITVLSGWAARCKMLRGGERQIVGFLLPGDFTSIYPGLDHRRSDTVEALTACEIVEAPVAAVEAVARERPGVARALQRSAMLESAASKEWLTNLGLRSAERRMAHLFCELSARLRAAGLATEQRFPLPVTQTTLGDALGLSSAHVNRTLQSLRASNLAVFEGGAVMINNLPHFRKFAGFDAKYLQI